MLRLHRIDTQRDRADDDAGVFWLEFVVDDSDNPLRPYHGREWETPPPRIENGVEVPRGAFYEPPASVVKEVPSTDSVQQLNLGAIALGPAKGGKKPRKKQVMWEVIRSLTPDDYTLLNTSLPAQRASLTQIRHSHHQLAQLLSEGRQQSEAALLTGYNPAYVSVLKDDPSFQDLIAYYAAQQELVYVDVLERMKSLGLSTVDELQNRLEEDSTSFTNRELLDQVEMMLVKPMVATRGGILPGNAAGVNAANSGVSISVNFIGQSSPKAQPDDIKVRPVVDVKAERLD